MESSVQQGTVFPLRNHEKRKSRKRPMNFSIWYFAYRVYGSRKVRWKQPFPSRWRCTSHNLTHRHNFFYEYETFNSWNPYIFLSKNSDFESRQPSGLHTILLRIFILTESFAGNLSFCVSWLPHRPLSFKCTSCWKSLLNLSRSEIFFPLNMNHYLQPSTYKLFYPKLFLTTVLDGDSKNYKRANLSCADSCTQLNFSLITLLNFCTDRKLTELCSQ